MGERTILLLALIASSASWSAPAGQVRAPARPTADAVRTRYTEALDEIRATGAKGAAVLAFLDSLPQAGGLFVVEGDMLMTEQEVVQTYLTTQVAQGTLQPGDRKSVV